jgi:hypothetical protein
MKILPYARSPDEEFANKKMTLLWEWSSRWSGRSSYETKSLATGSLLGENIRVRQDTDKFGFIFNERNGVVFYADKEALKYVTQRLEVPLETLRQQDARLLKDLMIIV